MAGGAGAGDAAGPSVVGVLVPEFFFFRFNAGEGWTGGACSSIVVLNWKKAGIECRPDGGSGNVEEAFALRISAREPQKQR